MSERRFDEESVAEIFREAARDEMSRRRLTGSEGLTLAELQEIGQEAGLSPEAIARAAGRVGISVDTEPGARYLGFEIGVARSLELPGPVSDTEWERIVVDLRETFQARGKVQQYGSLREWSNGNLHALVEPSESGHRLRFRTLKGSAREGITAAIGVAMMTLVGMLILAVDGGLDVGALSGLMIVALAGIGFGGATMLRLPGWAATRGEQMEAIARRAAERMASARLERDAAFDTVGAGQDKDEPGHEAAVPLHLPIDDESAASESTRRRDRARG